MSKKKSDAALEKERGPDGKFAKGVSGNPRGRPKKEKPADDLPADFHEFAGKDAKKALESLLSSAKTRYEAHRIAKDLLPYQAPKLSNVESYATEIKTIEIKWMNDIEGDTKLIEGELAKDLLETEIEEEEINE